jgi:outer membrane protein assembly factor BamB
MRSTTSLSGDPRRRCLSILVLLVPLLLATAPSFSDWPQWRGPEGLGVSPEVASLPEVWGAETSGIRWRTSIPGEGISSPIVSGDRVFVTTAYEGSRGKSTRRLVLLSTSALALVFLALVRKRSPAAAGGSGGIDRWDRRFVSLASGAFVLLAVVLAAMPDVLFTLGKPGRSWRLAGAVALLGLAAAFGWFDRHSRWRLVGVTLSILGVVLLIRLAPPGPTGPASPAKNLPFVFLSLALGAWYLFAHFRRRSGPPDAERLGPWIALTLAAASVVAFVPANYLNQLQRVVVGLDFETGRILWQTPVFSGPAEQKWHASTYATPTPTTDGEHVIAYFGHGIASVDFDGRLEWRKMFPGYSRSTRYGAGASPIITGDSVVLVREREENQVGPPSWLAAFDKTSGDRLWHVEPAEAHDSYTTPMAVPASTGPQVLTASWHALVAYDAGSGDRLWSLEYPMEQMVASLSRDGDKLALTGGVYGEKTLMVVDLDSEGLAPEILWQTHKGVATIASPVLYDGMLFAVTTPGILYCHDAETGEVLWKKRLEGEYFTSLVAGDGKVYATSTDGATTVVAAEPELRSIAVNELGGRVYASPAIAGGSLLIRTSQSLFRIDGVGDGSP